MRAPGQPALAFRRTPAAACPASSPAVPHRLLRQRPRHCTPPQSLSAPIKRPQECHGFRRPSLTGQARVLGPPPRVLGPPPEVFGSSPGVLGFAPSLFAARAVPEILFPRPPHPQLRSRRLLLSAINPPERAPQLGLGAPSTPAEPKIRQGAIAQPRAQAL